MIVKRLALMNEDRAPSGVVVVLVGAIVLHSSTNTRTPHRCVAHRAHCEARVQLPSVPQLQHLGGSSL